jgi:hypothetical protein
MELLIWLDNTALALWVQEAIWLYPILLVTHGMGMAVVVGISSMVSLRLLGLAPGIPLEPLRRFFPVMFAAFWINALSGVGLILNDPILMLTNWVMYIKLASIAAAVGCMHLLYTRVFVKGPLVQPPPINPKVLAGALLFIWALAITAGRMTAYFGAMVNPLELH